MKDLGIFRLLQCISNLAPIKKVLHCNSLALNNKTVMYFESPHYPKDKKKNFIHLNYEPYPASGLQLQSPQTTRRQYQAKTKPS